MIPFLQTSAPSIMRQFFAPFLDVRVSSTLHAVLEGCAWCTFLMGRKQAPEGQELRRPCRGFDAIKKSVGSLVVGVSPFAGSASKWSECRSTLKSVQSDCHGRL